MINEWALFRAKDLFENKSAAPLPLPAYEVSRKAG